MSINVFEMAFRENANLANIDSDKLNAQRVASKALSESVIKSETKLMKESIKLSKIRFTEDIDDIDIQPSEDVVVVYSDKITPEMSAEEVEKAAEELIGSTICKCGICGANYIADDNHKHADDAEGEDDIEDSLLFTDDEEIEPVDTEDEEFKESLIFTEETVSDEVSVDTDETEEIIDEESENIESDTVCPVCNAEDTQVEVGIIAPNEDADEDTDNDSETEDDESDDIPDEDDTKTDESAESSVKSDDNNIEEGIFSKKSASDKAHDKRQKFIDKNVNADNVYKKFPEPRDYKKSFDKVSASSIREGDVIADPEYANAKIFDVIKVTPAGKDAVTFEGRYGKTYTINRKGTVYKKVKKSNSKRENVDYARASTESLEKSSLSSAEIDFKDRAFNILLNKFVRENYKNIKSIRINEGRCEAGELVFEGVVNTLKGSTHPITFKTVKFAYTEGVLKLRMTESGVFTESAEIKEGRVPFVLECAARNGYIVPRVLKCKYNVRESGKLFECFGRYTLSK